MLVLNIVISNCKHWKNQRKELSKILVKISNHKIVKCFIMWDTRFKQWIKISSLTCKPRTTTVVVLALQKHSTCSRRCQKEVSGPWLPRWTQDLGSGWGRGRPRNWSHPVSPWQPPCRRGSHAAGPADLVNSGEGRPFLGIHPGPARSALHGYSASKAFLELDRPVPPWVCALEFFNLRQWPALASELCWRWPPRLRYHPGHPVDPLCGKHAALIPPPHGKGLSHIPPGSPTMPLKSSGRFSLAATGFL